MNTKARLKFHGRIAHYEADIELADIFSGAVKSGKLASATHIFDGVDAKRHPRLANRLASQKNQTIAIGHLYNTLCVSFIKDIYEDFAAYRVRSTVTLPLPFTNLRSPSRRLARRR